MSFKSMTGFGSAKSETEKYNKFIDRLDPVVIDYLHNKKIKTHTMRDMK